MALEIAVRIASKNRRSLRQAIFILESELEGSLSEVRTTIAKQDIETPNDYRFLSSNGNVIPWSIEETIFLRDVAKSVCRSAKKPPVKTENIDEDEIDDDKSATEKIVCVPELWLTSLEETMSPNDNVVWNEENAEQADGGDQQALVTDTGNEGQCSHCPWKSFVNMIHDPNSGKSILKIMFILLAVLFGLLASLMLTTHLIFGTLSSLTSNPEFSSLISKLRSDSSHMEEMTKLRLKVSEMELSWKFKFDQLNGKVTELEDLYLNDLAVHKREMASLRSRRANTSADFASQKSVDALNARLDHLMEFSKLSHGDGGEGEAKSQDKKKKKNKAADGA